MLRPVLSSVFALSLGLFVHAQSTPKSFKFVALNVPGAALTQANGINNHGEIVGSFQKGSSCRPDTPDCPNHGFKYISGKFTEVKITGALGVVVHGVNDFGDIAGYYTTSDQKIHGFLRLHTGKFQRLDFPGSTDTRAMAVNNSLIVVGSVGGQHGFVWVKGKFTQWDIRGEETINLGISNNGVVVGQVFDADFWNGWRKAATDVDVFPRFNSAPFLDGDNFTAGINNRGDIVGWSAEGNSGYFAPTVEAGEGAGDAPERKPAYVLVAFPGAITTFPTSINYNRAIVGTYQNSATVAHGFLAVPK